MARGDCPEYPKVWARERTAVAEIRRALRAEAEVLDASLERIFRLEAMARDLPSHAEYKRSFQDSSRKSDLYTMGCHLVAAMLLVEENLAECIVELVPGGLPASRKWDASERRMQQRAEVLRAELAEEQAKAD